MNSRTLAFALAAAVLVTTSFVLGRAARRGRPFFRVSPSGDEPWSLTRLLLASFLTLFAELAFIRWIAVEFRVFAYFKNLALLLCFVGFGLGCALARKPVRWRVGITALFGLLLVIRLPWEKGVLEGLSQNLGGAADVEIWATGNAWHWARFLSAAMLAAILFLFLVWIFVPLGQIVSRQMDLAKRPLSAYSWNLFGSLAGILIFLLVSRLMLPPAFWLGAVLLGFAILQENIQDRKLVLALLVPLVLLLHDASDRDHFSIWTPYQQISYSRYYAPNGDFVRGYMWVNHTGYQQIVNLSEDFLERHSGLLKEAVDENPYNVPFRFAKLSPTVLIVGSGTGTDVAAALRHNSSLVDAVDIDPAIVALGRREHPEHPYDSPKVLVHVTDARAFLKRSPRHYDLALFGLLDSHTQFSDYSNMRIDNFVYTEESFQEAKNRLNPDGVLFVKFQINHAWMATRIAEMLQQTFGKAPMVFMGDSSYSSPATCFVISPSRRVEEALASDNRLARFVQQNALNPLAEGHLPITTDDWPYLYQKGRWIPRTYFSLGVLVMLVGLGLYLQIPEARRHPPSLFFFSMGAGFLLLETQVISRLALYFGTTWQVNGIVIAALLTALLGANMLIERRGDSIPRPWIVTGLLAGLVLAYWAPVTRLPASPALIGTLMAGVFAVPVFFAGMLFALEFRTVDSPSVALGANMLGAVVGGLLENLSLLTGMRALLLVTMALYCLAGIGLWQGRKAPAIVGKAVAA